MSAPSLKRAEPKPMAVWVVWAWARVFIIIIIFFFFWVLRIELNPIMLHSQSDFVSICF